MGLFELNTVLLVTEVTLRRILRRAAMLCATLPFHSAIERVR